MKKNILIMALIIWSMPALAQEPLEITAAGSLDWDREHKTFTAVKDALATQGASSIKADKLVASYRDAADKNFDIYHIEALQHVVIVSENSEAFGDHAIYDLDQSLATLTGKNLSLVTPEQTVTARDKIEYHVAKGQLKAYGNAKVKRAEDMLEADLIIAYMRDDAQGKRVLDTLEAKGNVVITTPTETARGGTGTYRADVNKAVLSGDVRIQRGPNILEGEKAEIDLTTNTSRIFGDQTGAQRVRGVFYPDSEEPETEIKQEGE